MPEKPEVLKTIDMTGGYKNKETKISYRGLFANFSHIVYEKKDKNEIINDEGKDEYRTKLD